MSEAGRQDRTAIQAIRGTKDIFGAEMRAFQFVEEKARELFALYGYGEIRTPVLEATELFARSVGAASDIVVSKQMYTFTDPGDRSNTMRPEGTAGVIRALVECGAFKETSQQKVWYTGPMFRYEKPQKGRLRQFTQIGCEFFGVAHPGADAEIIILSAQLLRAIGFTDLTVKVNNIGDRESRIDYNCGASRSHRRGVGMVRAVRRARPRQPHARVRLQGGRVPGARRRSCLAWATTSTRRRAAHDRAVRSVLEAAEVPYEVDSGLVRGLDYYSQTVFEVASGAIGAQNAMLGGGRYD